MYSYGLPEVIPFEPGQPVPGPGGPPQSNLPITVTPRFSTPPVNKFGPGAARIPGTTASSPLTPPTGLPPGTPGDLAPAPQPNGQAQPSTIPTWVYVAGGAGILGIGYLLLRKRHR